ncbi:MAG: YciI-like protein [Caulobacterales bacterium]
MKHFILIYDYVPDFMEKRLPFRTEHLTLAYAAQDSGALLLAGAMTGAPEMGAFLFQSEDASVAENFARNDPYVRAGIVTRWHVREWITAVGEYAANPAPRPE